MNPVHPCLGAFLNGLPDVENLFPILAELQARGRIDLQLFVTTGLWRREPRVRKLLRQSGIPVLLRPNRLLKARFYYSRLLKRVNRMLVIGDPKIDTSVFGPRSRYYIEAGLESIWLQHGVIQNLVAFSPDDTATDFHSDPIFYWEDPSNHTARLAPGVRERIRVSGFTKRPVFPFKPPSASFAKTLAGYRKRVLICHTFRGGAYDSDQITQTYDMIRAYCQANPDVAVIVRPHRGKVRANYNKEDRKLGRDCPNVFFSLQHRGALRGMNMLDVLQLVDCMISTASTAILDSLFQGKPAALIASDWPQLNTLPDITDADSLAAFVEGGMTEPMRQLASHYGSFERNLTFVCNEIEARMGLTAQT